MNQRLVSMAALIALAATALQTEKYTARSATSPPGWPPAPKAKFVASSQKTFDQLLVDAMSVMDWGMHNGGYNGEPDHDFVIMMIPHHQGAIDMAKTLLLYGKDPQMRRLAQEIITDQESEIQLMQLWLNQHVTNSRNPGPRPGLKPRNN
jgi:uncharacterized protein (DUF305 family)